MYYNTALREWCAMHGLFQWLKGIPLFLRFASYLWYFIRHNLAAQEVIFVWPDFLHLYSVYSTYYAYYIYIHYKACIDCMPRDILVRFDLFESWFASRFEYFYDSIWKIADEIRLLLLLLLFFLLPLTSWLMCVHCTHFLQYYVIHVDIESEWFTSNLMRFMIRTANLLVIIYNAISITTKHLSPPSEFSSTILPRSEYLALVCAIPVICYIDVAPRLSLPLIHYIFTLCVMKKRWLSGRTTVS